MRDSVSGQLKDKQSPRRQEAMSDRPSTCIYRDASTQEIYMHVYTDRMARWTIYTYKQAIDNPWAAGVDHEQQVHPQASPTSRYYIINMVFVDTTPGHTLLRL